MIEAPFESKNLKDKTTVIDLEGGVGSLLAVSNCPPLNRIDGSPAIPFSMVIEWLLFRVLQPVPVVTNKSSHWLINPPSVR